jgi:hypothetical protein
VAIYFFKEYWTVKLSNVLNFFAIVVSKEIIKSHFFMWARKKTTGINFRFFSFLCYYIGDFKGGNEMKKTWNIGFILCNLWKKGVKRKLDYSEVTITRLLSVGANNNLKMKYNLKSIPINIFLNLLKNNGT